MKGFYKNSSHVLILGKKNNSILLTKRGDSGLWVMPGGHLQKKDSFKSAALREVNEETGIILDNIALKLILFSEKYNIQKRVYFSSISRKTKIKLSDETIDIKWFPINKLPRPMSLYEADRIKKAFLSEKIIKEKLKISLLAEAFNQIFNLFFKK